MRLISSSVILWLGWALLLVPSGLLAQPTPQVGYQTYVNARFGYRVSYPADFVSQSESDSGDGQVFTGPDEAELRAWGGHNVLAETPRKALREELRRCAEGFRQVTYRQVGKDFFVISGYLPDAKHIFYIKKLVRPDRYAGFEFIYPVGNRARYDRAVVTIARSLRLNAQELQP
ncbi:MAG: hypothetical protein ACUVR8_01895 [Acidobacteriota bacterium]